MRLATFRPPANHGASRSAGVGVEAADRLALGVRLVRRRAATRPARSRPWPRWTVTAPSGVARQHPHRGLTHSSRRGTSTRRRPPRPGRVRRRSSGSSSSEIWRLAAVLGLMKTALSHDIFVSGLGTPGASRCWRTGRRRASGRRGSSARTRPPTAGPVPAARSAYQLRRQPEPSPRAPRCRGHTDRTHSCQNGAKTAGGSISRATAFVRLAARGGPRRHNNRALPILRQSRLITRITGVVLECSIPVWTGRRGCIPPFGRIAHQSATVSVLLCLSASRSSSRAASLSGPSPRPGHRLVNFGRAETIRPANEQGHIARRFRPKMFTLASASRCWSERPLRCASSARAYPSRDCPRTRVRDHDLCVGKMRTFGLRFAFDGSAFRTTAHCLPSAAISLLLRGSGVFSSRARAASRFLTIGLSAPTRGSAASRSIWRWTNARERPEPSECPGNPGRNQEMNEKNNFGGRARVQPLARVRTSGDAHADREFRDNSSSGG